MSEAESKTQLKDWSKLFFPFREIRFSKNHHYMEINIFVFLFCFFQSEKIKQWKKLIHLIIKNKWNISLNMVYLNYYTMYTFLLMQINIQYSISLLQLVHRKSKRSEVKGHFGWPSLNVKLEDKMKTLKTRYGLRKFYRRW